MYCILRGVVVHHNVALMSLALDPEYTFMEETHAWVLVEKFVGLRVSTFFLQIYNWWCFWRIA